MHRLTDVAFFTIGFQHLPLLCGQFVACDPNPE